MKVYNIGIIDLPNASEYHSWRTWLGMLKRVATNTSYVNVSICEEWKTFSNFNKWFEHNHRKGWGS